MNTENHMLNLWNTDANYLICSDESMDLINMFTYTAYVKDRFTKRSKKIKKTIVKRSKDGFLILPLGLYSFIQKRKPDTQFIERKNYELKINPEWSLPGIIPTKAQKKLINSIKDKNRGIFVGSTGMGKSVVLGGIISYFSIPTTVCIVPNRTIFNQMIKHLSGWFGAENVGMVGDGIYNPSKITVAMFQSLNKFDSKFKQKIELVQLDECHRINTSIIKFLQTIPNCHYRFGVTATPRLFAKNYEQACDMYGWIGDIIEEVTDEEVTDRVLPVKVKLCKFFSLSVEGKDYKGSLRKDVLLSEKRNKILITKTYNEALSKGMTCLMLIDETKQGNILCKIAKDMRIPVEFVHSKLDKEYIDNVKDRLNKREIKFVIATQVFGIGTDIPNIDCVILGSCRKSYEDTLQKIGRGRRKTETCSELLLIDVYDKLVSSSKSKKFIQNFEKHSQERINLYRKKGWDIKMI